MTIDLAEQLGLHLDRLLENCRRSVEDLTADELNHQPSERAHSIGFDIWHVVRTVDNIVFFVFDRQKPVWLTGGFDERFGLPRVAQGTGMTDEEARALRFPEPSAFVGYIDAVRAASVERVRSMSDDELAEVTKVNPWGDRSKAEHILQVLIAHGNGHIGRCSLARALLGKDDLGI
ncbi:MAG: DinB family protein [Dehalococcoidia bacterium]|nr:DinB family protein [Dehalococcoidia bacterium]MCA9851024.1 DinB family protein [Dehalococcoidia bacterium]MCA9856053.1 DinB family protein [Dehalococcoidia bacterium]MCB9482845.1 DinB family protein [Dehalococcoidia bacterium]MCB9492108.1 DinB family protein [Dehalococcoidia bacterium]